MGGLHEGMVGWLIALGHRIGFYFNVLFIFSCIFYHMFFFFFRELFEDNPNIEKGILAQFHSKQSASKECQPK